MSSKLNYDKWANLELSDDSDIETHPNVDKKSMIRWKQQQLHEERETRRLKIGHLAKELEVNASLLGRIDQVAALLPPSGGNSSDGVPSEAEAQDALSRFSSEVERLKSLVPDYGKQPPRELKPGEMPSEDHMMLSLVSQVANAVNEGLPPGTRQDGIHPETNKPAPASSSPPTTAPERARQLATHVKWHKDRLMQRQDEAKKEKSAEEEAQKKKITSDDMHYGWDSKTMITKEQELAQETQKSAQEKKKKSDKGKQKVQQVETLNAPGAEDAGADADAESDDEDMPALTDSARRFAAIPPGAWERSLEAIRGDKTLLRDSTVDAVLVEAFNTALKANERAIAQGKAKASKSDEGKARDMVHQALLVQYCLKLGRDGVSLFFQRMTGGNQQALKMFLDDVKSTADRLVARAAAIAPEQSSGGEGAREQIQLYASDPNMTITFDIPDGPPPEQLEITGEGAESLDPQLVREFLQRRWDTFTGFAPALQEALKTRELESVNKVLGEMDVPAAEQVVQQLQEAGILSFESADIIDATKDDRPPAEVAKEATSRPAAEPAIPRLQRLPDMPDID